MHAYYTKCNTNVHRGESGKVVVWKGGYHAYTSKGMERHAPRKWGQGLRGNVAWEEPCLTGEGEGEGEVFPGTRRGVWYRESFQGSPRGWKRGGMEWNGVERSARRVRWCRGVEGTED